jgi:hypothetical protein
MVKSRHRGSLKNGGFLRVAQQTQPFNSHRTMLQSLDLFCRPRNREHDPQKNPGIRHLDAAPTELESHGNHPLLQIWRSYGA